MSALAEIALNPVTRGLFAMFAAVLLARFCVAFARPMLTFVGFRHILLHCIAMLLSKNE
jgi:hypothetical protein